MNNFYIPFLITFLAGISTTIGYFFIYLKPKNVNGFIGFSLAFSGSIMFFISLFELIPDGFFYLLKEYNLFVADRAILILYPDWLYKKAWNKVASFVFPP